MFICSFRQPEPVITSFRIPRSLPAGRIAQISISITPLGVVRVCMLGLGVSGVVFGSLYDHSSPPVQVEVC